MDDDRTDAPAHQNRIESCIGAQITAPNTPHSLAIPGCESDPSDAPKLVANWRHVVPQSPRKRTARKSAVRLQPAIDTGDVSYVELLEESSVKRNNAKSEQKVAETDQQIGNTFTRNTHPSMETSGAVTMETHESSVSMLSISADVSQQRSVLDSDVSMAEKYLQSTPMEGAVTVNRTSLLPAVPQTAPSSKPVSARPPVQKRDTAGVRHRDDLKAVVVTPRKSHQSCAGKHQRGKSAPMRSPLDKQSKTPARFKFDKKPLQRPQSLARKSPSPKLATDRLKTGISSAKISPSGRRRKSTGGVFSGVVKKLTHRRSSSSNKEKYSRDSLGIRGDPCSDIKSINTKVTGTQTEHGMSPYNSKHTSQVGLHSECRAGQVTSYSDIQNRTGSSKEATLKDSQGFGMEVPRKSEFETEKLIVDKREDVGNESAKTVVTPGEICKNKPVETSESKLSTLMRGRYGVSSVHGIGSLDKPSSSRTTRISSWPQQSENNTEVGSPQDIFAKSSIHYSEKSENSSDAVFESETKSTTAMGQTGEQIRGVNTALVASPMHTSTETKTLPGKCSKQISEVTHKAGPQCATQIPELTINVGTSGRANLLSPELPTEGDTSDLPSSDYSTSKKHKKRRSRSKTPNKHKKSKSPLIANGIENLDPNDNCQASEQAVNNGANAEKGPIIIKLKREQDRNANYKCIPTMAVGPGRSDTSEGLYRDGLQALADKRKTDAERRGIYDSHIPPAHSNCRQLTAGNPRTVFAGTASQDNEPPVTAPMQALDLSVKNQRNAEALRPTNREILDKAFNHFQIGVELQQSACEALIRHLHSQTVEIQNLRDALGEQRQQRMNSEQLLAQLRQEIMSSGA